MDTMKLVLPSIFTVLVLQGIVTSLKDLLMVQALHLQFTQSTILIPKIQETVIVE